jgi:hypothetical protein
MKKLGRFFFLVPAPFLAFVAIAIFGMVANPPEPAKSTTYNCLSFTKGNAVEDEPGKFEYTCELRK